MMRNRTAGRLMERLERLAGAGLRFHAQVVCCPGVNDGAALMRTLSDLYKLHPAAQSVAVVPVGLTRYRDGLTPLRPYTPDEAREMIARVEAFAAQARRRAARRLRSSRTSGTCSRARRCRRTGV